MPVVNVLYTVTKHGGPQLLLKNILPGVIADRLNVGEKNRISADDVIVIFQEFGQHDVHSRDVVIQVTAHNFPERAHVHDKIADAIADDLRLTLKYFSFSVIVNLTPLEWSGRDSAN